MSFDFNQPFDYNPEPVPSREPGATQQQEIPAWENPEPLVEPNTYPGSVPSFFPYLQYPNLTWQPRVDIFEDHDNFLVVVEVPGVSPEQLNVENSFNLLLIRGQSRPSASSSSESMIPRYQERACGHFSREIQLPPHASLDQAAASCRHGLLEIRIPKKQPLGQPGASH